MFYLCFGAIGLCPHYTISLGSFASGKLLCILACCLGAEPRFAEFMMPSYCASGLCATRLAARALASLTRHILFMIGFQTEVRAKFRLAALVALARLDSLACWFSAVPDMVCAEIGSELSADLTSSACQSPLALLISHISYLILTFS